MNQVNQKIFYGGTSVVLALILIITLLPTGHTMSMDEKRNEFISMKEDLEG